MKPPPPQRNVICLYSQETIGDLPLTIRKIKENGYDMVVSCKIYSKWGQLTVVLMFIFLFISALVVSRVNYMANSFKKGKSFSRSDMILESTAWVNSIVAKISEEFDCDAKNDDIRKHSQEMLSREIDFADHVIPYGFSLMKITGLKTTNLSRIVSYKQIKGQLLIEVPMTNPRYLVDLLNSSEPSANEHDDPWQWWNKFRVGADFSSKLSVALEVSANIPSRHEILRWQGEPVGCLIIPSELFTNKKNYPDLSRAHINLVLSFKEVINNIAIMVKCNIEDENLRYYSKYLRNLINNNPNKDVMYGSDDVLQIPLQPLYDNLDTYTYEVFETDPVKYLHYQRAIEMALVDLIAAEEIETKTAVVMVVGAGRGPLLRSSLNAAVKTGRKIKLYAIEKNPHAINSLQALIDELWKDKDIELIARDMRDFNPPEKADILVSELLGSFGDNELSPECLDGAQKLLKPTGVSIPCKYTSYINPVMSCKVYNSIRRLNEQSSPRDRISCSEHQAEHMYVIYLKNAYNIAEPKPLFEFTHPNRDDIIDNSRFETVSFETQIDCVLTGFAGYFDAVLYKDITLSIHPITHSKGLWSWFPAYFPISEPIHLKKGSRIVSNFWRCIAPNKVWYEWSISNPVITHIHNLNGIHHAIYL